MKETIVLAGGCFWGVEEYYSRLKGVISTLVGYANGDMENPRYEDLKHGVASHAEAVRIEFDPDLIPLEKLLEHFLRFVDPYSIDKQGHDEGHQYRSGVYYLNDKQKEIVLNYFSSKLEKGYRIEVEPLENFYDAEEYHQDYLKKNPSGYCHVNLSLIKKDESKQ